MLTLITIGAAAQETTGVPPKSAPYREVSADGGTILRNHPSAGADALEVLPKGSIVIYVYSAQNDFSYVRYKNMYGYALSAHIKPLEADRPQISVSDFSSYRTVAYCEEFITLRDLPSSQAGALKRIPLGSRVEYLGKAANGFSKVRYMGLSGYAMSRYLAEQSDLEYVRKGAYPYTYGQMIAELAALAAEYPERMTLSEIGKSALGKPIPVAILGNASSQHKLLAQASIHAREYMTSLLAMREIERMLKENGDDFFDRVCICVVPMTNPDGVEISQAISMSPEVDRIYQSDRARGNGESSPLNYLRKWRSNANGVDLNRNFDAQWGEGSLRETPSSGYHHGAAPEDQPESKALADYLRNGGFKALLNYHASGSMIYYDFPGAPANGPAFSLAQEISNETGYPLIPFDSKDSGGLKDYALLINIPSITLEIGEGSCPLDESEFVRIWSSCKRVMETTAEWVLGR